MLLDDADHYRSRVKLRGCDGDPAPLPLDVLPFLRLGVFLNLSAFLYLHD